MSIIYEPKNKAREYSPLAANFYNGCNHGCIYCYSPAIRFMSREQYLNVSPRGNIFEEIERSAKKYNNTQKQVLFCFMGDPYCEMEMTEKITQFALEKFLENRIPVAILTKAGKKCLRDIDLFKKFGEHIKVGATLTFWNEKDSKHYEPNAALPAERLEVLKELHNQGIKTWASFEPVIIPEQSLKLIKESLDFIDEYKIGKINNYNGLDKTIDWNDFLGKAVVILREAQKPFYVKYDLRQAANKIKLFGNEVLMDEFLVKGWDKNTLW